MAEYGRGFSRSSIVRMIQFFEAYPDSAIVASLMRQLSWTHFIELIKIKEPIKREFYTKMCVAERSLTDGWIVKDCLYGGTMLEMSIGKNKTGDHARGSIPERLVGATVHDQPVGQVEPIIGLSGEISLSFGKNDAVVFSIEKL